MKTAFIIIGGFFGVVLIIGMIVYGMVVGNYNSLITEREEARTQEAQIEAQMQRRADLVPNLVASTKGAMQQERAVFDDISKAHAAFSNAPAGSSEKIEAGNALGAALRGYLVVAQQYPNLKSLDIVRDLNTQMEGTENRISVARQRYNESVQSYNRHLQTFPTNMFASMWNFEQMSRFEANSEGKVAPKVNFDDQK